MEKIKKIILEFLFSLFAIAVVFIIFMHYFGVKISELVLSKTFWIVMLCITIVLLIIMKLVIRHFHNLSYLKSPLSKVDKMTGEEFELYLKTYFEKKGYKVELTPLSNDYGADLICTNKNEKVVVQAKRYEGTVGNSAVQEVVAARDYYEADRCIVVTNSHFTKNAIELAEVNSVELWDRDSKVFKK